MFQIYPVNVDANVSVHVDVSWDKSCELSLLIGSVWVQIGSDGMKNTKMLNIFTWLKNP